MLELRGALSSLPGFQFGRVGRERHRMSTAGQDLLSLLAGAAWDVLGRCRSAAEATLAGLGPQPGLTGTVLDGRLLQPFPANAIGGGDPAVAALVAAATAVLPNPGAGAVPVALHGYDPGGGQPRGLALAAALPGDITLVAALTGDGPSGIALEVAAAGAGSFGPVTIPLAGDWSVAVTGSVGGGGRLQFAQGAPPRVLDVAAPVSATWSVQRDAGGGPLTIGPAEGPSLVLGAVGASLAAQVDAGGNPSLSGGLILPSAQLSLPTDMLAAVLGSALALPLDVDLGIDPAQGVSFRGGGVKATVPVNLSLPGVDLRAVEVSLTAAGGGLSLGFGVAFTAGLPGLPVAFTADGLGAGFPIAIGQGGGGIGIDPGAIQSLLPTGLGIDLTLPVLAGGGFLATTGPGGYAGVLALDLDVVTVQAFGLLQLPQGGAPLSFAAILSVGFPFPGIELGFGFALTAVGGIVAVNRRLDFDALHAAVVDGSAAELFFPTNPAGNAPALIAALGSVFPAADGHVVIGPMLQIGWGGRIVALSAAVVIDLPDPAQFAIVGRLVVALPDPAVPLVLIQATLGGGFQTSPTPTTLLFATLDGSNIAGMPLSGDLMFLVRGGADATFVLSAGGFHPRYALPAGVPPLNRIQLDITPPGFPGLRSEAYFALTSNSVQFGAHLELCDEIAGCGVDGWFHFDALFRWEPSFAFAIDASAGVAVQVLGETLMGISFDLTIEGPAPWHIYGTGSIDLFLFSASLDFDVRWGEPPPALPPAPDLFAALAAALADPAAWVGVPPADARAMVTLSTQVTSALQGGSVVHPLGSVVARQRAVPFRLQITRFQNAPVSPQTWTIVSGALSSGGAAQLGDPTFDSFPPGQFVDLSEEEELSRPAFDAMVSGGALSPTASLAGDLRPVNTGFETHLIPDIALGVLDLFVLQAAEALLTVDDIHAAAELWVAPNAQPITVLASPPLAVATTATLAAQPLSAPPAGFTATLQAAQAQFGAVGPASSVQVVEAWELAA